MKSSGRFDKINLFLKQMLPMVRMEAAKGRWADVKPQHFRLMKDENQSYLTLSYSEGGIYDMTFNVGTKIGGFDPEASGEWFECIYEFRCFSCDAEIKAFYMEEQQMLYRLASTILDWISYKALFFYRDEENHFSIAVKRELAFTKFCLMLDVFLPLKNKHEASKTLITKSILAQKETLENVLGSTLEIVPPDKPDYIFSHGHFMEIVETNDENHLKDCPF